MTALDLAILAAFVAYSVAAGFAARRRASLGLEEYFLAGRSVRGWRAGCSMAATQFSADTPLLVAGLIAAGGIASLWRLWSYALAFLLMGFVLGAAWRRAGVLTDAEFTVVRYGGRGVTAVRALKAVYYGTVINCTVLAFVLVAAARVFEVFLPWHEWLPADVYAPLRALAAASGLEFGSTAAGLDAATATANAAISLLATVAFVALYSATGGLRSVIATDVAQLALMFAGTLAYAWFAVAEAGGLDGLPRRLAALYGEAEAARLTSFAPAGEALAPFLTVLALQWLFQMNADGTGYLAQRTMACASDAQARAAAVIFTYLQVVVRSLLWIAIGLALLAIHPLAAPVTGDDAAIAARETLYAAAAVELLPPGLLGLMATSLLAALASTIDTHLNWGAGYWTNDLYRPLVLERWRRREARPGELVRVARLSTVLLLVVALAIATQLGSIQAGWQMSLLFGAGVGAVLVLRWLWERVNLACEVVAIVVSLVLAPPLILWVEEEWLRLAAMAGVSTLAVVLAALHGPPTPQAQLAAFYGRVRPPGWWTRTALAAGEAPGAARRRLARGLLRVAACAASAYALLVGLGQWWLRPGERGGSIALLALAVLLVPLWWRGLRDAPGPDALSGSPRPT